MKIEKTFIVVDKSDPHYASVNKVFLAGGRYFKQSSKGALGEISEEEFTKLNDTE